MSPMLMLGLSGHNGVTGREHAHTCVLISSEESVHRFSDDSQPNSWKKRNGHEEDTFRRHSTPFGGRRSMRPANRWRAANRLGCIRLPTRAGIRRRCGGTLSQPVGPWLRSRDPDTEVGGIRDPPIRAHVRIQLRRDGPRPGNADHPPLRRRISSGRLRAVTPASATCKG
jgi:hypothetical protein